MKYLLMFVFVLVGCKNDYDHNYLLKVFSKSGRGGYQGYKNLNGDTIIPLGRYLCFTDTFKNFAIVYKPHAGFIGIDRSEKELFKVFIFDSGPDYPSEGYFRILLNGKMGYCDTTGIIRINPEYGCALPFENGIAKVAKNCTTKYDKDHEHSCWISKSWYYINKLGVKVNKP